ncbi:Beta-glucan synthesis-associated [Mycena chlorophos]|uniref:Beta-glucan synthesis-associated n=1 Tax=Mycena chlorophos TaxID=658473 RepID=A0A8H6T177_MYCCL|nr:Beta-glucan synthesis-associated [Mycena chlorophos]
MDGGFDDLVSSRGIEDNPFADPFARSSSPDPWSRPFQQQEQDVYTFQRPITPPVDEPEAEPVPLTPTTDSVPATPSSEQPPQEEEPAPAPSDPLDSAAVAAAEAADGHGPLSPHTPGFRESVEDPEADPTFSEIATIRPTEPEEMQPSIPIPIPDDHPHAPPRMATPPRRMTESAPSIVPSLSADSGSGWGPLDGSAPIHSSFPNLVLGGESAQPWGDQGSWSNEREPQTRLAAEDDSDDDKPILQTIRQRDGGDQGKQQMGRDGLPPVFVVTVDDPQKVGDPIRSFTMYTVHTRTTSPLFQKSAFSVLRRYSDFLWLYETLSQNNPGVVVPPVPEKSSFGRFEEQFVKQRRLALEKCITKIANHPVLMKDPDLKLFLESDTFSLDIKHRKAEIAHERGGLMASIGQSLAGPRFFETDEWFDRQKGYLDSLESQLRGLVKAIEAVSKQRSELAVAMGEFGQAVSDLSASDVGKQLAQSLAGLAEVQRKTQDLQNIQADQDLTTLLATADEYARLINSVRLAFNSRIRSYHSWRASEADSLRVKQTHERNRAQGRIPNERVGYSLAQVSDAERRALDAKHEFDMATKRVKEEVARFEKERVDDFKDSLHAFLEGMIQRQKVLIGSWENYQQMLLKKVGGGRGLPPGPGGQQQQSRVAGNTSEDGFSHAAANDVTSPQPVHDRHDLSAHFPLPTLMRRSSVHGAYAPVPSAGASHTSHSSFPDSIANAVASNQVGSGYGPYSYPQRDSIISNPNSRFSATQSSFGPLNGMRRANTATINPQLLSADADLEDALHDPNRSDKSSWTLFSLRGWANASMLFILVCGLIGLFLGYPIATAFGLDHSTFGAFNIGGINSTGQVPKLTGMPTLIDQDTPEEAYSRTGVTDGKKYNLVFSDEFNVDGRSFYPGDDPYWTAVDLYYWPTRDLEWYDPGQVTTANGKMVITMEETFYHDLNFVSGMVQSWNQFCFTTGYVEVSVSLPGSSQSPGFWPGAWSMGNLGRAGYGATTEGTWPYSYDSCDVGTLPNQTDANGNPAAAATGGNGDELSFLPGQKLSACTCPGEDHPGPSVKTGRGVPEIDILEAQIDTSVFRGQVSQSYQIAPFDYDWQFVNTTPAVTIYDDDLTKFNTYKGSNEQQAISALTYIPDSVYSNESYGTYGYEWWSDPSDRSAGYITWISNGTKSWTVTAAAMGPDETVEIGQRLIPEEPMYLILNLGMSPGFQPPDFQAMSFPNKMYIDYVRVYQREDVSEGTTCDPSSHPTADYINNHMNAYTNPNLTIWSDAGYTFPKNSLSTSC